MNDPKSFEYEDEDFKSYLKENIGIFTLRARQINILNHFIFTIFEFKKPTAVGLCGSVVTPFFGISLVNDFRFAAENMVFSLSHLEYGLHPSGALPFFLPKFVGQAKASEILMKGGTINAEEALRLNLINEIFPEIDFEDHYIREFHKICEKKLSALSWTKRLLNNYGDELKNYIELESKIIRF